jgi:hypothetical protein
MHLEPLTIYIIVGFVLVITVAIAWSAISKSFEKLAKKLSIGNFLFGIILVGLGIDFLINPVSYTYRAQYDLRGWLKWVAAFCAIFPGVFLILNVRKKENTK